MRTVTRHFADSPEGGLRCVMGTPVFVVRRYAPNLPYGPGAELRGIIQSSAAVNSPVVRTIESADGVRYVREFNAGRIIGVDKFNGNQATSVMTIMTDRFDNLVSTFPGLLK
ncbi:hypothetical protein ANRL3_02233 [Anaerolineae bacterium]|nr:hypothetical protein ANRL3_02233 [Anaerolineae bacterium]